MDNLATNSMLNEVMFVGKTKPRLLAYSKMDRLNELHLLEPAILTLVLGLAGSTTTLVLSIFHWLVIWVSCHQVVVARIQLYKYTWM